MEKATGVASPPRDARRIYVAGGIMLILAGLVFGDIFAVFILHQNARRIGDYLAAAGAGVSSGDASGVAANFQAIGSALENRGTKVDTHVHIIDFGYLALLLALLQRWLPFAERQKRRLAILFMSGAVILPVGVYLIHYVGLAYSPLSSIGWASIAADLGGLLVLAACAANLAGFVKAAAGRHAASHHAASDDDKLLEDRSWSSRVLLSGGTLLILGGFLQGCVYAALDLYSQEDQDASLLRNLADQSSSSQPGSGQPDTAAILAQYNALQGNKAVKIAAHAHAINFGVLALLLALIQPYVLLSERWRRGWALVLLAGSAILPIFVMMELRWGLTAGGIADAGGALVALALCGMLYGVMRSARGMKPAEARP